jgi:proline dehydrogenase
VSDHIPFLRGTFLYLSRQKELRRWMETSPHARRLTSRFIAGLNLEDGLRVAGQLASRGMLTSLDHLGENVKSGVEARRAAEDYLEALRRIAEQKLPATISAKLTSLGLDVSEELCRENASAMVRLGRDINSRVEFDMEDSSYTDRTLRIVQDLHAESGSVCIEAKRMSKKCAASVFLSGFARAPTKSPLPSPGPTSTT